MKKLIVAASAAAMLLSGAAASALPANNGPTSGRDGRITQAELVSRADRRFARLDANRDGRLTQAELTAGRRDGRGSKAGMQRRDGRDGQQRAHNSRDGQQLAQNRRAQAQRFDRNRDGVITRAEFRTHALERFANRDGKGNGHLGGSSQPQARR